MKLETRKLLAEGLGSFFLVFMGCGAIVVQEATGRLGHLGVALAWGLAVLVVIHAFGEISGAHVNPAVTAAFAVAGRFPRKDVALYCAAQVAGAITAALLLKFMFPVDRLLGATLPQTLLSRVFGFELVMSFLLMFVIMAVSSGSREQGMMAGVAVGATVALDALVGGPVSGASMNPARSLGPALVAGRLDHLWLYMLAPVLGTCAAAKAYQAVRGA